MFILSTFCRDVLANVSDTRRGGGRALSFLSFQCFFECLFRICRCFHFFPSHAVHLSGKYGGTPFDSGHCDRGRNVFGGRELSAGDARSVPAVGDQHRTPEGGYGCGSIPLRCGVVSSTFVGLLLCVCAE